MQWEIRATTLSFYRVSHKSGTITTAHYSRQVRTWVDMEFPGYWIGRQGPVEWPPRSPDFPVESQGSQRLDPQQSESDGLFSAYAVPVNTAKLTSYHKKGSARRL